MGKKWSIKVWIAVLVNVLLLITSLILALFFYREFQKSLNERVLLQLTSIKRLKRIQIEDYLEREWSSFDEGETQTLYIPKSKLADTLGVPYVEGQKVYDLSLQNPEGTMKLAFVKPSNEGFEVIFLGYREFQRILNERTGMGQSGESYIVGKDFRLRTQSRFYPYKKPTSIICKTEGVRLAIAKNEGRKIIQDYRGTSVFSAFHTVKFKNLTWVMLSEIDEEEALQPLYALRIKMILIFISVQFIGFVATLIITSFLSQPINRMKVYLGEMTLGNYDFNIDDRLLGKELIEMYEAFKQTVNAMRASISFSKDIGKMKLDQPFEPYGKNDILGQSLISMRNKLKSFTEKEATRQIIARRALIQGEEKERQRLSAELHDGIGPMLTTLKIMVENDAGNKGEIKKVLDDTVEEVRRITFNLMPQSLLDFGLEKALFNFINLLKPVSKADLSYTYHSLPAVALSTEVQVSLFRVSQEAMNNGIKHANANFITLVITEELEGVDFYYADDGNGFDSTTIEHKSGLNNMKIRVESMGGSFELYSTEIGTTIQATIPFKTK